MSEHFKGTKGYEFYGNASDALRAVGLENSARIYSGIQAWGTPEQLIEKLRQRRELLGDFELSLICHYGGMPVELAEQSMRLFADEVLPGAASLVGAKANARNNATANRRSSPEAYASAGRVCTICNACARDRPAGAHTHCGLRGTSLAVWVQTRAVRAPRDRTGRSP